MANIVSRFCPKHIQNMQENYNLRALKLEFLVNTINNSSDNDNMLEIYMGDSG
jgi:hypothetical protein